MKYGTGWKEWCDVVWMRKAREEERKDGYSLCFQEYGKA